MNAPAVQGFPVEVAAFSERGPRAENQDAFMIEGFADSSLLALADGMGGEKSGRVAADTALAALARLAPIRNIDQTRQAIREANDLIVRTSASDPDSLQGMGCALGVLSLVDGADGPGWIAAHVGDVRIFSRSPDGVLRLETRDHTPAFARWEAGEISLDEVPDSAGANRLQRAVGRGGDADVVWLPAAPGWSWLIVSDGVYKSMRLDELNRAMAGQSAKEVCESIRSRVTERGAEDNYTAIIARATGDPAAPLRRPSAAPGRNPQSEPMNASKRSTIAGPALFIALLSLLAAGYALWSLGYGENAMNAEMGRLRAEVDSLRAVVVELSRPIDPFGPSLPTDTPAPADTPTPPAQP